MRLILPLLLLAGCAPRQSLATILPRDGWTAVASFRIVPGLHSLPDPDEDGALRISGDNLVIDGSDATLNGSVAGVPADEYKGTALIAENCRNLTIRGLSLRGYKIAMRFKNCDGLTITDCDVSLNYRQHLKSTPRGEDGADWLFGHENDKNEWFRFGAGIYIESSKNVTVARCRARNGQNGLCLDKVTDSAVIDNDMSFMSGWGLAMWRSSRNDVSNNKFDWCMRGFSYKVYHRGQDSAGIFVYEQCHDNLFAFNSATHGGDGFFLYAGNETLQRTGTGGCNRNILFRNDFSHAAANGIEATFSDGNQFVENRLDECDHGVWAGYSYNTLIVGNTIRDCNNGISIEHGHDNVIARNTFERCGIGIHLWAGANDEFKKTAYGKKQDTDSHDYDISENAMRATKVETRITETTSVRTPAKVEITFKEPKTRGTQQALLPRGAPRGWKYIFVDDWGPYDFTTLRLFSDGSSTAFFVLGPPGEYAVVEVQGAEVTPLTGRLPATLSVKGNGAFSFAVTSGKERATAKGFLLSATWSVKVFAWERQGAKQPPKDWDALVKMEPLQAFSASKIDFTDRPNEKCPSDYFATLATTDVDVPAGAYELGTLSDDGVRCYVDDKLVIDNWTWHGPTENKATVTLTAGKHSIRLEHFEIDGYAQLRFWLAPR